MSNKLITQPRSIIVACDVPTVEKLREVVEATGDVPGIGGYKIGLVLALLYGLTKVVETIRKYSQLPIIYDHQKGGVDIPDLGFEFAKTVKSSDIDAVILFPFGGRTTATQWIKACQREELIILLGGHMTQPEFLASEGGFIADSAPEQIYKLGAKLGVTHFVVPGNKIELVLKYRQLLERILGEGNFVLYAPGFVTQGGNISDTGKIAGPRWHAIIGSAIYKAGSIENMRQVAMKLASQIVEKNQERR